jgi:hypothetical protein
VQNRRRSAKLKTQCKIEDSAPVGFSGRRQAATRPARMVSDRLTPPMMQKTKASARSRSNRFSSI